MIFILAIIETKTNKLSENQQIADKKNLLELKVPIGKSNISSAAFKKFENKFTVINNHTVTKMINDHEITEFANYNVSKVKCGKCHSLAKCVWPGICQCPPGYEGDGTNACNIPTPYSFSYMIGQFPENSTEFINVSYTGVSSRFNITKVYCKIGTQISPAISYGHLYALCNTTYSKKGLEISLSFDGVNFGEGVIIGNSSFYSWYVYVGIGAGIILGIYAIFLLFSSKPGPLAKKDEVIPLTKDVNRADDFDEL
ncbi:hypothetical protein TVAG_143820 [Trichomonas vaginalis G3]|uniref:Uncharacterized protein n=1 Tax=Trichomonas vaginalis (strain ATCC PRA-98 / G3) TaxID=412133 RepID=A2G452_TRIV3|nr:hypothetical protein TVAGG3_0229320 [Trichomonas vaginalis G3]EAX88070.1 hypothetical protein TVAG_143820 [Trichomonas vaginalis G3]KAI5552504.1 hypothetical protein TVAGG3_0229320 [Trichomonas vaginalis G3]|eukprot:XP_001301000.1 hypothetical protein [Trichomonas vaginalis G3]